MSADQQEAAPVVPERTWPVAVALKHPVDFADEHITSLSFRRGKMGDLKGMTIDGVPTVDQQMLIASRMCGKPVKVIEMIADEDCSEVLEIVMGFFWKCLGAGKTG